MDQQFPALKTKNKTLPIIRAVVAIVLLAGIAIGAYYVSGRVSGRQAIAPTAPTSRPFAGDNAARNAAACAAAKCKANEVCKGEGNCVWQKPKADEAIPGYVCTVTNCPAPAFHCANSNTCVNTTGYSAGHLVGGTCSEGGKSGTFNASGKCAVSCTTAGGLSGTVQSNGLCGTTATTTGVVTCTTAGGLSGTVQSNGLCGTTATTTGGVSCTTAGGLIGTVQSNGLCGTTATTTGGATGSVCTTAGGLTGTRQANGLCGTTATTTGGVSCTTAGGLIGTVQSNGLCGTTATLLTSQNDPNNCGGIGRVCPAGKTCVGGACTGGSFSCPSCQVGSCAIGFGSGSGTCDPAGMAKTCCVWVAPVDTIKCGRVECDQATSKCCPSGCKPIGTECGGGGGGATISKAACTDTTWSPSPATVCTTETLTQKSNCDKTRIISGTKSCGVVGACTELKIYKKNADGTFGTTPLTTAELANLKLNDTLQLASKGSIASLKARFKISIDSTEEAPGWRDSSAYKDTAKTISVLEYKITKPGKYKFEAEVSSKP